MEKQTEPTEAGWWWGRFNPDGKSDDPWMPRQIVEWSGELKHQWPHNVTPSEIGNDWEWVGPITPPDR